MEICHRAFFENQLDKTNEGGLILTFPLGKYNEQPTETLTG